jgi:hypothetical protein
MPFLPLAKQGEVDVSGDTGSSVIYIGDEFNGSVTTFKAFLKTLSYDFKKEVDENTSTEKGSTVFIAKNGLCSIKLGFSVVAKSGFEAKENLAKISHLQMSIRQHAGSGLYAGTQAMQMVYFSNLVNNGIAKNFIIPDKDTLYVNLRDIGFRCVMEEVKYEPDISMGFMSTDDGIFPKAFDVNINLNPDTSYGSMVATRQFLYPFYTSGHYHLQDSCFFPFLVKTRADNKKHEDSSTILYNPDFDYTLTGINQREINRSDQSKIFISLPIDPGSFKAPPFGQETYSAVSEGYEVPRYVVFEPFLESVSRTFKTKTTMLTSPNGTLDQQVSGVSTNEPVAYNLSFNVPAISLDHAKKNAAKMEILMRLFYKRAKIPGSAADPTETEEQKTFSNEERNSLKVYVYSILEKGVDDNSNTNDINVMYDRALLLQSMSLTIDIDVPAGFFESGGKFYPKVYKVSLELKDGRKDNFRKQTYQGQFQLTASTDWDKNLGNNTGGTDIGIQRMLSNIVYWKNT